VLAVAATELRNIAESRPVVTENGDHSVIYETLLALQNDDDNPPAAANATALLDATHVTFSGVLPLTQEV
jgi:hypothetical protein